jgi:DNA replication protein DnaC
MAEAKSAAEALSLLPGGLAVQIQNRASMPDSPQALRAQAVAEHHALLENLMQVPMRYREKGLETLAGYDGEKDQSKLALSMNGSVFLTGGPGTGKTHMAIGLMWEWLKDNLRIESRGDGGLVMWGLNFKAGEDRMYFIPTFLSASDLYSGLKESFDRKGPDSEQSLMKRYAGAALLVLDDVGAEQITDWKRSVLYSIVDQRYRDMKQTIITSNMSLDELSVRIDDRISSRIVEMGAVITMAGEDYRLKAKTA